MENCNPKYKWIIRSTNSKNIDILFIYETNLFDTITNKFFFYIYTSTVLNYIELNIPDNYQIFISNLSFRLKFTGHGVAIYIKKQWVKYIFKFNHLKEYAIQFKLLFKGKYIINLFSIYNPPSNKVNYETWNALKL